MIIIPQQDANTGDLINYEGQTYRVDEHFAQGKDLKDKPYTHIMFSNKGAYGMIKI